MKPAISLKISTHGSTRSTHTLPRAPTQTSTHLHSCPRAGNIAPNSTTTHHTPPTPPTRPNTTPHQHQPHQRPCAHALQQRSDGRRREEKKKGKRKKNFALAPSSSCLPSFFSRPPFFPLFLFLFVPRFFSTISRCLLPCDGRDFESSFPSPVKPARGLATSGRKSVPPGNSGSRC
jgi:hypothetical protein